MLNSKTNKNGLGMPLRRVEKTVQMWLIFPTLTVLLGSLLMAADPTPCEPCRSTLDTWSSLDTHEATTYPGCQVRILFRTRQCDHDGCFEVDIERVESAGGSCDLDSILNFSPEELTTSILAHMLYDNPMDFPPYTDDSDYCWKLKRPRCWRKASNVCPPDIPGSSDALVACDTANCCVSQIAVKQDTCGNFFFHDYPIDHQLKQGQDWSDSYNEALGCSDCAPEFGSLDCGYGCVEKLMQAINRSVPTVWNE